jgi:hypothetical protein
VQFTQAGSGAVERTVESKLQDTVSVKDFGAVGNGVTDDTAAFNAAISFANAKGGNDRADIKGTTIYIPGGQYRITEPLAPVTVSSVYFEGDSKGSAVLLCSSPSEIFTFGDSSRTNTVVGGGVKNVKIEYLTTPAPGSIVFKIDYAFSLNFNGLMLQKCGMLFSLGQSATRVAGAISVSDVQGSVANIGLPLFDIKYGSGLFVSNCIVFVEGVGVPVHPASMTTVAGSAVFRCTTGFWDTLQVDNCLFERWDIGLLVAASAGMTYQIFRFTNTIFDYIRRYCVYLENTSGVVSTVTFDTSCWFTSWETPAIYLAGSTGYHDNHIISGTVVMAEGCGLIYSITNASSNTITNLHINGCNRAGAAQSAMLFTSGSKGFTVSNVKGNNDTANYAWSPLRADYGITIEVDCDKYLVTGCALEGAVGGYNLPLNTTPSSNRRAFNNIFTNYSGYIIKPAPPSGVTYTNLSAHVEEWNLFGGTLTTGYDKNGLGFPGALANVSFRLQPNDNFTVGYSVAPTVRVFVEP